MPRRASTHVDSAAAVGERLRTARQAAGLTQRDLMFPGCTAAYISRIEAGARTPSLQILREFGKRLGVSAEYLATGVDDSQPDELFEAEVAFRLDNLDLADKLYRQVETRAASVSDPIVLARAKAGLGHLALRRGDQREAIEVLEEALETGLPDSESSAAAEALGRTYASQGRFPEALDILGRFFEVAKEREDKLEMLRFGVLLANALIDAGNYQRAEEVLAGALEPARQSLDPMPKANLYWSQSRLYAAEKNPELAAHYARLTIATLQGTEHTLQAARALLLLAHVENDRGNAQEALDLVDEGERAAATAASHVDRAQFMLERARALEALGEGEEAASLALGAVGELQGASSVTAARGYAAAARFFQSRADDARALELYELSVEQFPAPDRHLADVLTSMAEIHERQGNTGEALQLLKSALAARSGVATPG